MTDTKRHQRLYPTRDDEGLIDGLTHINPAKKSSRIKAFNFYALSILFVGLTTSSSAFFDGKTQDTMESRFPVPGKQNKNTRKVIEDYSEYLKKIPEKIKTKPPEANIPPKWKSGQCTATWETTANLDQGCLYEVPKHIGKLLEEKAKEYGIPYVVAVNLIGSESGFKNVISPTGAMGIPQIKPETLHEKLYENTQRFSEKTQTIINKNIEKYNSTPNKYNPTYSYRIKQDKNGKVIGDKEIVHALAMDEKIGLELAFQHMEFSLQEGAKNYHKALTSLINDMDTKVNNLQKHLEGRTPTWGKVDQVTDKIDAIHAQAKPIIKALNRPFTTKDLPPLYIGGATGGAGFLVALANPEKHEEPASDYFPDKVVKNNPTLFFTDYPINKVNYSVIKFDEHMKKIVGNAPIPNSVIYPQETMFEDSTPTVSP